MDLEYMIKYKMGAVIPTAHFNTKHGLWNTTIYRVWLRMKQRCQNPNDKAFKWYGERGIKVSCEWQSFSNFYRDMGEKPSPEYTLERIDNNEDYCRKNCKWATMSEQGKNRRTNYRIEYKGESGDISYWAKKIGVNHASMKKRLTRWTLEEALTKPRTEYAVHTKSNNRAS